MFFLSCFAPRAREAGMEEEFVETADIMRVTPAAADSVLGLAQASSSSAAPSALSDGRESQGDCVTSPPADAANQAPIRIRCHIRIVAPGQLPVAGRTRATKAVLQSRPRSFSGAHSTGGPRHGVLGAPGYNPACQPFRAALTAEQHGGKCPETRPPACMPEPAHQQQCSA